MVYFGKSKQISVWYDAPIRQIPRTNGRRHASPPPEIPPLLQLHEIVGGGGMLGHERDQGISFFKLAHNAL